MSIAGLHGNKKGAIHSFRIGYKLLYIHTGFFAMAALPQQILESIHPALWRGSQLARAHGKYVDTGYAALSVELPGGGWPLGTLVELLVQQPGVGEVRLLQPALAAVSKRPIALLQPPQTPNALAFAYMGLPLEKLMLVRAPRTADALWSAEQMLKAGSCGAVVLWQQYVRSESVRRLHLAAQSSDTLFLMVRPLASAPDSSTLRLGVRPAGDGITVSIVKRKGPMRAETISVVLRPSPVLLSPHGGSRRPMHQTAERPDVSAAAVG
jgi:protein ImuA